MARSADRARILVNVKCLAPRWLPCTPAFQIAPFSHAQSVALHMPPLLDTAWYRTRGGFSSNSTGLQLFILLPIASWHSEYSKFFLSWWHWTGKQTLHCHPFLMPFCWYICAAQHICAFEVGKDKLFIQCCGSFSHVLVVKEQVEIWTGSSLCLESWPEKLATSLDQRIVRLGTLPCPCPCPGIDCYTCCVAQCWGRCAELAYVTGWWWWYHRRAWAPV